MIDGFVCGNICKLISEVTASRTSTLITENRKKQKNLDRVSYFMTYYTLGQ